jgi:hypothetical protein
MGEALIKFKKEIEEAHKIGISLKSNNQGVSQVSYKVDANSFTGEVELHTYVTPIIPLKYIKVNVVANK